VVHQHDHPVAGPHYDLRLQFSESSSLSWAIMYGLPGNPNSRRINRNATETRVHCVWVRFVSRHECTADDYWQNYLIETGSARTDSMIIWDTGEYEILPYYPAKNPEETDDAASDASEQSTQPAESPPSESEKLRTAFLNVKFPIYKRLYHIYTDKQSVKYAYDYMERVYQRITRYLCAFPRRTTLKLVHGLPQRSENDVKRA